LFVVDSGLKLSTVPSAGQVRGVCNHDVNVQSMCEWKFKLEIEMCVLDSGVNVLRCRVERR